MTDAAGSSLTNIDGLERASPVWRGPVSIAQMEPGFFWTRTTALGFPDDFTRQIDDGSLPPIYHDAVRQRVRAAAQFLDAVSAGRPS